MRTRRAQALIELSIGMLAMAIVISALCLVSVYIAHSLKAQNSVRGSSSSYSESVDVDDFAARCFVGEKRLKINERAVMPSTTILK